MIMPLQIGYMPVVQRKLSYTTISMDHIKKYLCSKTKQLNSIIKMQYDRQINIVKLEIILSCRYTNHIFSDAVRRKCVLPLMNTTSPPFIAKPLTVLNLFQQW